MKKWKWLSLSVVGFLVLIVVCVFLVQKFRAEVDKVFQERMSGRKNELLFHISRRAGEIYNAALRDTEKWEKEDYAQSVANLLKWVNDRYDYFETKYGSKKHENLEVL